VFTLSLAYSYFIPEDGDEETQPNVFLAPKPRQPGTPPTLGQVKFAFPLPGTYHFRFKSPLFPGADREKGAMAVWMDTTNDQMPVPTWKNSIVAKVTRVNVEDDDDDDDDADFGHHHAAPPVVAPPAPARAPVSHQSSMHSAHSAASSDHVDLFDGPSPNGGGGSVHSGTHSAASGNLFDNSHHQPPAPSPAAASDLLGMDYGGGHTQQHQQHQQQHQHNDFLGMTAPPHTPAAQPGYGAPYRSTPQRPPQQHQQQQQQQQQQQPPNAPQQQQNAFNSFTAQSGPFGGLGTPWK
jgi:hypothetical protein